MCAQSFPRFSCSVLSVTLFAKIIHSDIALSLSLPLYVPLLIDPDRGYLSGCSECSESPWLSGIPPREVETAWKHVKDMLVVLVDETRAADKSMRTYITDDGESGDWFAGVSSACQQIEFQHCR